MTEILVAYIDRQYRCYRTTNGLDREYFGPRFGGPYLAGQYADLSAGRPISPLRRATRPAQEVEQPPVLPEALPGRI